MRIWIKASVITFAIALVILGFQYVGFLISSGEGGFGADIEENKIPTTEVQRVKLLKDSLFVSISPKNYSNFALRLSNIYFDNGSYDSAASYKELIATRFPNEENWKSAGLMYFKAFEHASGEGAEQTMAAKAIECLQNGLTPDSSTEVKIALATLYFSYEKPQEATDLLQEVLASDTANTKALYLLGIHWFQLNKFEQASDYLNQLVKIDANNINGLYFLAVSKVNLGNTNEAKVLFEKMKLLDISAEVKADVDDYLSDIK